MNATPWHLQIPHERCRVDRPLAESSADILHGGFELVQPVDPRGIAEKVHLLWLSLRQKVDGTDGHRADGNRPGVPLMEQPSRGFRYQQGASGGNGERCLILPIAEFAVLDRDLNPARDELMDA